LTAAFGVNIFVGQAVFKMPLSELYRGLNPFIALSVAALMVVTCIPQLSLWILRYVG
jgi:C4-dicarboxylate transporter DctM subunit